MNIYAAIPSLISSQRAAVAEAKRLGCSIITLDDQLSPTRQVDNMDQLITQKVGGIMVYPVVPTALAPSVAKAKAAGIHVVSQNTPVDASQPVPSGFDTTIIQSFDQSAYLRAQAVAAKMPGATFAIIGLAAPVASLQYLNMRTKYWAQKFGLKFVDEVDAQQDNATAATAATTALLAKQKNLKVIFAYNDTTAVAVSVTARTSGRGQVAIVGSDGVKVGIDGVKAGNLFGTTRTDFATIGVQMVDACYDLLSGQKSLPRKIVAKITFVSKGNVASITPSG